MQTSISIWSVARAPAEDNNPRNADLTGPKTFYVVGGHQSAELLKVNEAAAKEVGVILDYKYNDKNHPKRVYYRSDHYNFARNGVPVLFYTSGEHIDYHKPTDTVEKIDFAKIQQAAKLAFLTGWKIADRKQRLKVDTPTVSD